MADTNSERKQNIRKNTTLKWRDMPATLFVGLILTLFGAVLIYSTNTLAQIVGVACLFTTSICLIKAGHTLMRTKRE